MRYRRGRCSGSVRNGVGSGLWRGASRVVCVFLLVAKDIIV